MDSDVRSSQRQIFSLVPGMENPIIPMPHGLTDSRCTSFAEAVPFSLRDSVEILGDVFPQL